MGNIRKLIKLNSKGSIAVTLPKVLCCAMGLSPGDKVEVSLGREKTIILKKVKTEGVGE